MGRIRKKIQRQVYDVLDQSVFTSHDFKVEFGDDEFDDENMVYIEFLFLPKFWFSVNRVVKSNQTLFKVVRNPGDFEEEQTNFFGEFDEILSLIHSWCNEVRHELKADNPIYSELDKLKETIEKHINVGKDENEFSAEDIFELRKNFEELEKRVEELEKEKVITEKQASEFKEGVIQVIDDIEYYPKKTWIKTASNKLSNIISGIGKTKEGRAILADGAKKLLGFE